MTRLGQNISNPLRPD